MLEEYRNGTIMQENKSEDSKEKFGVLRIIGEFILVYLMVECFVGVLLAIPMVIMVIWTNNPEVLDTMAESVGMLCISNFVCVLEIAVPIIWVLIREKRSIKSMGIIKEKVFSKYVIGYIIGALMLTSFIIISVLFKANKVSMNPDVSYLYVFLFFIGFIIQGAAEEVFLRGYFLTSLSKKTTILKAIIISSIAFAVLHLANPGITILAFANLILFGVFMSVVFFKTNSIWMVCGIHAAWNFFEGAFFGTNVSGLPLLPAVVKVECKESLSLLNGGTFGPEGGLIVLVLLIIGILIAYFIPTKKKEMKKIEKKELEEA